MKGLSKKEIEIVSSLELDERSFFTTEDIDKFSRDLTQRYNIIKQLLKKKRIVKLNRNKYYLIPVKAASGSWSEYPQILADEIMDGKDYFIGGWYAANHWRLTDQVPMRVDIYTTKRQGKKRILNTNFIFHRTTRKKIEKAETRTEGGHKFRIMKKEDTRRWLRSRH